MKEPPFLLTDTDIRRRLPPDLAIDTVRADLLAGYGSQSPGQVVDAGGRRVVVTGAIDGADRLGVRLRPAGVDDDVAMAWGPDGHLLVAVVGREFGVRRTGAVGAVAVDALARRDARVLAVIGSGRQAWGQLWGISAVRDLDELRVASPTAGHATLFADRARAELGLHAVASPDARTAVEGADVVVLATSSSRPVIEAEWVEPGAHVSTIGPKSIDRHETPPDLVERAAVFTVDHQAQVGALGERFFSTRQPVPLAAVLDGTETTRSMRDDLTMFCSVGLPAADLALLRAVIAPQA